jgi:CheY-like chemotaxis protein
MHGKIWATSEGLGKGSEFTVLFPILRGAQSSPTVLSSNPLQNTQVPSQKILLVEDNKSTALVMTRFLKKLGHAVKTAYCVREGKERKVTILINFLALDMAANNKFELVVSDLGLPDGSGFDLMKSLHGMYGLRGICVSGYGMEEDLRKSRECGFDIHIVKPVEISSLQSAIAFVVQKISESH